MMRCSPSGAGVRLYCDRCKRESYSLMRLRREGGDAWLCPMCMSAVKRGRK
jgi:hypothetical protein